MAGSGVPMLPLSNDAMSLGSAHFSGFHCATDQDLEGHSLSPEDHSLELHSWPFPSLRLGPSLFLHLSVLLLLLYPTWMNLRSEVPLSRLRVAGQSVPGH